MFRLDAASAKKMKCKEERICQSNRSNVKGGPDGDDDDGDDDDDDDNE